MVCSPLRNLRRCGLVAETARSAPLQKLLDDQVRGRFGAELRRVDVDLGVVRDLIGAVDAGEILELPSARLGVEPLGVALFGLGQRRIDEYLDELAWWQHVADHFPLGAEGRDEGGEQDRKSTRLNSSH